VETSLLNSSIRPDSILPQNGGRAGMDRAYELLFSPQSLNKLPELLPFIGGAALRDRPQKPLAIAFGHDARVKHGHDSAIGPGADEPAKALAEKQRCLRDLVFKERIFESSHF
jgi:hypothetical protein